MAEAVFRHGDPVHMDYTPSAGNVAAGEVVLLGNTAGLTCGIAHLDITNNALGALAVGGGIYDVTMITNIAAYTKVYWDDTNNKVTSTSTNNATFGYLLEGGTGANTVVECLHQPYA
ncbi:MAG TPA: DUF2190 family protein [Gemmata sp.]|jgi:hypothetical protein|nr:DUF2190 family protein [Gemmata sp.]